MYAPAVQVNVGAKETPVAAFAGAVSVGQVAGAEVNVTVIVPFDWLVVEQLNLFNCIQ